MTENNIAIFMQDNAPCHTSKLTKGWLDQQNFLTMKWPPYSPDLNPIEHIWAWIKALLHKKKGHITNYSDLEREIRELWDEFEAGETKEAKFAITLDKTQPIMLNDATDGRAWMEHGVKKEQIMARNKKTPDGSVKIWDYFEKIINKNVEKGRIKE